MKTVDEIINHPIKATKTIVLELIQFIDLTTLEVTDHQEQINLLVENANTDFHGIHVAAICTYSNYGAYAKSKLNPKIKAAVVGGCFPSGQTLSQAKINECQLIAETDIDEIDIVVNRGMFFDQEYQAIEDEIRAIKNAIGTKLLKVILETGDYTDASQISKIAQLAINGGADFIKTSTGKSGKGASPEAVYAMCLVIQEHYQKTGKKIGIKPSGGIRTTEEGLVYYTIVREILGSDWLTPQLFRIGASSLYTNLKQVYEQV